MAKLHISNTIDEVLSSLAEYFINSASESIAEKGSFTVALSGGSSPKRLYALLSSSPYKERVEWDKLFFFFGDERYVPATDDASNFLMADKILFEPLKIVGEKIFAVDTMLPPDEAASKYMENINNHFGGNPPAFDLVLLGLGDNSHTASLFPHTPILQEQEATVKAVFLDDQQLYRISFTAPLINLAKRVAFLVYGEAKAEAVYHTLEDEKNPDEFPAQLIEPKNGMLEWFLDRSAAAQLIYSNPD
jgi:6-phosphogluconolactonase